MAVTQKNCTNCGGFIYIDKEEYIERCIQCGRPTQLLYVERPTDRELRATNMSERYLYIGKNTKEEDA